MRLMRYDKKTNKWYQLFSDDAVDKYKNLSDLEDVSAARDNLRINDDYWNKHQMETAEGGIIKKIHHDCIGTDDNAQFVSNDDVLNWNNKVDRPVYHTKDVKSDGQFFYDKDADILKVRINNKLRDFENNRACCSAGAGAFNFAGMGNVTTVTHGIVDANGNPKQPKYVSVCPTENPLGRLGEVWVNIPTNTSKTGFVFEVGNTGSYTGPFSWMAYY